MPKTSPVIRNIIMYSVVSAVRSSQLSVFIISTVVMEKHRDIAILKSMGFARRYQEISDPGAPLVWGLWPVCQCGLMFALAQVRSAAGLTKRTDAPGLACRNF
jgi:hypothetical protein